jgi:hypothetical protein
MCKGIAALVFLLSITVAATAQLPGGSISLGYTYLTSGSLSSGPLTTSRNLSNLNGFSIAGEFKLLPWISGVAEYGATFGTEQLTPPCEVIIPCSGPFHGDTRLQTFSSDPARQYLSGRLDHSRTCSSAEATWGKLFRDPHLGSTPPIRKRRLPRRSGVVSTIS